jgi:hypothetical protein
MIDCSHANSGKNHLRQCLVALYARRMQMGGLPVRSIMIESNIFEGTEIEICHSWRIISSHLTTSGRQNIVPNTPLRVGVSVTDACISWKSSALLLSVLNEVSVTNLATLAEARDAIRLYDDLILQVLSLPAGAPLPSLPPLIAQAEQEYVCLDQEISSLCAAYPAKEEILSLLVSLRLTISEAVARIKFREKPFEYTVKTNNLWQLVTHLSVEMAILDRVKEFLSFFLRILNLSKHVQVLVLEKVVESQKIGHFFGLGSITHHVLAQHFHGSSLSSPSEDSLYHSLLSGEVDFGFVPIHNTISGPMCVVREDVAESLGTFAADIHLSLFSNRQSIPQSSSLKRLYLAHFLRNQVASFLRTSSFKFETIVEVSSTAEGVVKVMTDDEPAGTLALKGNNLYCLEEDIVKRNVTTFALIKKK